MTVYQEAYQLISKMPDESVKHLVELLKSMTPEFLRGHANEQSTAALVTKRLGAGKGIIVDSPDFDKWDAEAAALFEGGAL